MPAGAGKGDRAVLMGSLFFFSSQRTTRARSSQRRRADPCAVGLSGNYVVAPLAACSTVLSMVFTKKHFFSVPLGRDRNRLFPNGCGQLGGHDAEAEQVANHERASEVGFGGQP